jgi:tRNA G18 (ribose-2'-O)-methylase SpoU
MPVIPIDDLDDPRIAIYGSLKATNQTRNLDQFVVEGEKLVARLLESRFPVISLLLTDRYERRHGLSIPDQVTTYVLPHALIDRLIGFPFHRGVLACAKRLAALPALEVTLAEQEPLFFVICPKLSDPGNLGAIARIGDVFGIDGILTGPECPDPFSRRVLRVSMGAVLRLPIYSSARLESDVDALIQRCGVRLLAAVTDPTATPFDQEQRPRRLALVLGDEDRGIDPAWLAKCHAQITIPMRKTGGSLNVAVAAGILIHGLARMASGG